MKKGRWKNISIYSTKNINLITFFITIAIFLSIIFFISNFTSNNIVENNSEISSEKTISENLIQEISNQKENDNQTENNNIEKESPQEFDWYIEIPSIYLKAPIAESTNNKVLNEFVGHFEETSKTDGNIGVAGHNRGYKNNYFENVNKLKKGDEIKYKYNDFEKSYIIENIKKIKSTDWSYLENSEQNIITLITCIENEPDYRLCIQAVEKL